MCIHDVRDDAIEQVPLDEIDPASAFARIADRVMLFVVLVLVAIALVAILG